MIKIDRAARNFIDSIKEWAMSEYANSFGASCIIESLTDEEILEFRSLRDAKRFAKLKDDQFKDAQE